MVAKNNLSVNVVGCPIHRENNNWQWALETNSSRRKAEAALIYKTLAEAKKNLQQQLFQLFPNGYKKRSRQSSFY
jgi:pantoate--beta-alanine ligase